MIHKIVKKPLMPSRGMPFSFKERELATHFSHEEQEEKQVERGSQVSWFNVRRQKNTRELRQREADYRCCIPALAGFAGSQSIVPGSFNLGLPRDLATLFYGKSVVF